MIMTIHGHKNYNKAITYNKIVSRPPPAMIFWHPHPHLLLAVSLATPLDLRRDWGCGQILACKIMLEVTELYMPANSSRIIIILQ